MAASNLGAEITEKMKLLEQIQNQLRMFQAKLTNSTNSTTTAFTQEQIQSLLTIEEQNILQRLVVQRKTVQSEIQLLQQKLLAPSSQNVALAASTSSISSPATAATNILYVPTNSKPQVMTTTTTNTVAASNGQFNTINSKAFAFFFYYDFEEETIFCCL